MARHHSFVCSTDSGTYSVPYHSCMHSFIHLAFIKHLLCVPPFMSASILSFTQQTFIKHLLFARHSSGRWGASSEPLGKESRRNRQKQVSKYI